MTTKQEYYQIFRSAKKPNDRDTLAVLTYFGDDIAFPVRKRYIIDVEKLN